MELTFGFGNGVQTVCVPDAQLVDILRAGQAEPPESEQAELTRALLAPIGCSPLHTQDLSGKKIAIVTSDITRPLPTYKVMPVLLDELYAAGARPENITLVFALGSHRNHTPAEMDKAGRKPGLAGDPLCGF